MLLAKYLLIFLGAYLVGSVNTSVLLSGRMARGDVRDQGSGNAGATNMARLYGMRAGLLTLAGDMVKAAAAAVAGFLLSGDTGLMLAGMGCMVGHCFPVFHSFKGGKGVAPATAILLCTDWRASIVSLVVFLITAFATKKVSPASIASAAAACLWLSLAGASPQRLALGIFCALLIVLRHKDNIRRLVQGTEPDFHPRRGSTGGK